MASNIVKIQLLLLMAGSCLAGTNFRLSSATMVATEGSPVSLQCRFSYRHDNRYFVWQYVPHGGQGALRKLMYWEPGSQQPVYPAGSTDRYLGTKDLHRGTMSLQISRTMSSDASRYFCQITDNLWDVNATDWCGCGISLSVERIRPPSVQLLAPFLDGAVWSARATLICKAVGFYPEKISFRWMVDRKSHSLPTEQDEPVRSSGGTYNATSRIHIPFLEWDRIRSVNCLVTHISKATPFVQEFRRRAVPAPQPPITFLLRPPDTPTGDGASDTLTCGATGFYPASLSFGWEVDGRQVDSGVWNTELVRTPNGTYHAISTLNTPRFLWSSGARYTCLITHQELEQPIRKNISLYDHCQPTWCPREISWLWVAAAVATKVIYTGIVLCIFHGIWTCWQRRRGSIPESRWVNLDIPMEKIPEDVGKGMEEFGDQERYSEMWTPLNLKLDTSSTTAPLM